MKKKNKRILFLALAVLLVSSLAIGSLAYFTDSGDVVNTFMVAEYDPDNPYEEQDQIFSILVDEEDIEEPGTRTETGNEYGRLKPADVFPKDPTVYNTGKYPEFVRFKVTVNNAEKWQGIENKYAEGEKRFVLTDLWTANESFNDNWKLGGERVVDTVKNEITYTYYLNEVFQPEASSTLFTKISIPAFFDNQDIFDIQEFDINCTAQAIQSEHTGSNELNGTTLTDAEDAQYAFETFFD